MRYEVKIALAERDHDRLRAELLQLPSALRELHPPRVVQSVYFDTQAATAVHDNLDGHGTRTKLRFRWYGSSADEVIGILERKRRDHMFGDKDLFAATAPVRIRGSSTLAFAATLRRLLPSAAAPLLDGLDPVQWIRYRREYLTTADAALRITLDRDLAAYDQRLGQRLQDRFATPLPRLCIVEIKADAELRAEIEAWLQRVDLRPSRCSKFVMASRPAEAPIASRLGG